MPKITDNPPAHIKNEIADFRTYLDDTISAKTPDNVIIGTWNIRSFGSVTEKWEASQSDSPKRDLHALLCIIEVIKSFDIVAVQEVKNDIKCLRDTMRMLGEDWSFVMTDVTRGDAGNGERLAFIFNNKRVKLSGLACEIVVPKEQLDNNIGSDALDRQFARTPYGVGFKVKDKTIILLTLHVLYGDNAAERIPELKAIADWMYDWAKQLHRWNQSLMVLGDFNIDRKGDPAYEAFVSKGLFIPDDISAISKTIFGTVKHYDQIGWYKNTLSASQIELEYVTGDTVKFKGQVLKDRNLTTSQLSWRISDHYPLWAEFKV